MFRKIYNLFCITAITVSSSLAHAQALPDPGEPLISELLPVPIPLACAGIQVDEWRGDSNFLNLTSPSPEGIARLNELCALAIRSYPRFARQNHLKFTATQIDLKISLIPADTEADGFLPRNLNDPARMKTINPSVGQIPIWGVYNFPSKRLLIRNDVVNFVNGKSEHNGYFEQTYLHELLHVMNDQYHTNALNHLSREQDEALAQAFSVYLGFLDQGSSRQDMNLKKAILRQNNTGVAKAQ